MWTRRRSIFLVVAVTCVVAAAALVLHLQADNRCENANMVATWEEGIGKPLTVEGVVIARGSPVAGRDVDIETGSGGNTVTTGPDGKFSVNVGELEIVALTVDGAGSIEWGPLGLGSPGVRDGVRFRIELK
jgi:hypothetical protein